MRYGMSESLPLSLLPSISLSPQGTCPLMTLPLLAGLCTNISISSTSTSSAYHLYHHHHHHLPTLPCLNDPLGATNKRPQPSAPHRHRWAHLAPLTSLSLSIILFSPLFVYLPLGPFPRIPCWTSLTLQTPSLCIPLWGASGGGPWWNSQPGMAL